MNKIFKFKQWLSINDAAKYLSELLQDTTVKDADIIQLALDKELILSVYFIDPVVVAKFIMIPIEDSPLYGRKNPITGENYGLGREGEIISIPDINNLIALNGIFDLPMTGNEKRSIERMYFAHINKIPIQTIHLDHTYIQGSDDELYKLMKPADNFEDIIIYDNNLLQKYSFDSALELPGNCQLVVRTEVFTDFIKQINDSDSHNKLSDKERNNLLKTIGVLAELYSDSKDANRLKKGGDLNFTQISKDIDDYLFKNDLNTSGMSISSLSRKISEAYKILKDK